VIYTAKIRTSGGRENRIARSADGRIAHTPLRPLRATTGLVHCSNWCLFDLRPHRDYCACTCTGAPRFPAAPGAITR
jgi:hypothetical protein